MQHLFAVLLLVLNCAVAAHAQDGGAPRVQAEAFLAVLQQGKVAAAYAKLFTGSNIQQDQGAGIRKQTESVLPRLGRILGGELLREDKFGGSLVRLTYLLRSERHPTVWEFYFYKPANRWFVAEINFTDKLAQSVGRN
jgi:hypothetical protein